MKVYMHWDMEGVSGLFTRFAPGWMKSRPAV
jgi:hypothetical protein